MAKDAGPLRVVEESPAYWRIVFDYPPFNIVDATLYQALQDLLARMGVPVTVRHPIGGVAKGRSSGMSARKP